MDEAITFKSTEFASLLGFMGSYLRGNLKKRVPEVPEGVTIVMCDQ